MMDERLKHVRDLLEQAYSEISGLVSQDEPAAESEPTEVKPETAITNPLRSKRATERAVVNEMVRDIPVAEVRPTEQQDELREKPETSGVFGDDMSVVQRQIAETIKKLRDHGLATTVTLDEHLKEKRKRS